ADVFVFPPQPVRGVGRGAGGFALMIEDRGDLGPTELQHQTEKLVQKANQEPGIVGVRSVFRANVPQYHIRPDPGACTRRKVPVGNFADTLSVSEGSLYVNDFTLFGRTWQVIVQAEPQFRSQPENVPELGARNFGGTMVPIGSLAT